MNCASSTYTCSIFVGFSTFETFLVCTFALSFGGLTFHLLALSRALSFVGSCPFPWPDFFPVPVLFPFHDSDPLPDSFDVLDFAPAPAGDLTSFFLQRHLFNLIFRQRSIVITSNNLFFFRLYFCPCLCDSIHFSAYLEFCRPPPFCTTLTASSTCRSTILSFSHLPVSQLSSVHLAPLPPFKHGFPQQRRFRTGQSRLLNRTKQTGKPGISKLEIWVVYTD